MALGCVVTDVIAPAPDTDVGGVHDAGGLHVWRGGASFAGTRAPLVNASVPGAKAGDQLGY